MRPKRGQRQHQLGRFWLWQRLDSGTWCICWLERGRYGRHVTRRKTTPIRSDIGGPAPHEAIDALAAHQLEAGAQRLQPRTEALVENLMADWVKLHVSNLADPVRYINSTDHWAKFFDRERMAGRLTGAVTVADLTPQLQARFRTWRTEAGVGGHTISRDLAALRGALNWAWKNQRLEHAPFIADVPPHQKAPARDRVLTFEEIAAVLDHCVGRPEREHLIRFIVVELGTAGRPDAVLELTDKNIDLERGLIDPNHEGRVHGRKRRAIVPIARHVLPWVTGVKGKLIKYRVPIAKKNQVPDGPEFFERETKSIKTVWKAVCEDAGVKGASPKTLRHTMLTWLAMRGVPKEQRSALAGHTARDTTARNYEHLSPDYLRAAVDQVDAFFEELAKHTSAHLRYANDTEIEAAQAA